MAPRAPTSFADTSAARALAALVVLLVILTLGFIHRHELFPVEHGMVADPARAACVAERSGHVTALIEDGVITPEQGDAFRARAIQFCEQMVPAR